MRKTDYRRSLGAVGIAALAMSLVACGGNASPQPGDDGETAKPAAVSAEEWKTITEAAKDEGELVFYSSLVTIGEIVDDFKAQHPEISVRVDAIATADLIARVDQEMAVGQKAADVVLLSSAPWFAQTDEKGLFAGLKVSPEAEKLGWLDEIGDANFANTYGTPMTITHSTSVDAPSSIAELVKKDPGASIGLVSPEIAPSVAFQYETLRLEYGDEILDALAKMDYTIQASNIPLVESVGAGEQTYGYPGLASLSNALIEKGAKIADIVPDAAVVGPFYRAGIPRTAPHPNAAQVFVNWLMSEAGAKSWTERLAPATTFVPVEGSLPWGSVAEAKAEDWTQEKWNAWLAEHWTPRFG